MRKAFTLVELLIVIAIIAILAAIAIPQYTQYMKKAAVASAQSTLSSCLSAAEAQFADNGSQNYTCYLPGSDDLPKVTIELNGSGVLDAVYLNGTPSNKKTDGESFVFKIKGHTVNCTLNATENIITCQ